MDFPSSVASNRPPPPHHHNHNLNPLSFPDCFADTMCTVKISLLRLTGREKKAQLEQTC